MTVEVKYVVIREGEEKMSFASKKEADAYDKMLDLAEVLGDWLGTGPVDLEEETRERMAMWLAEQKDALNGILKSGKLPGTESEEGVSPVKAAEDQSSDAVDIKSASKRAKVA